MRQTGYIVFAHGSRLEAANESVRLAARRLAESAGYTMVDVAFLDCVEPDLLTVVGLQVKRGADRVVVIPYFLTLGRHAAKDLPSIVEEASRIHKGVTIEITDTLDGHPALSEILLERARQAEQ
ncbi:MAG: cobalamin biosynthesis protein CbiX [bacterium]|nr:cobalamin biosynthesis protein CbiX [bacterium]